MSLSTSHNPLAVLDKARAGDDEALSALLQIYLPYLKLLARLNFSSRLSARIDASDLVQETALQVQRDLFQFRGKTEKELMAWFRRIMANTAAASMRHHTRRRRDIGNERAIQCRLDESSFMITEAMASPGSSPSQRVGRRERAVLLAEALSQLTGDQREVLILREFEGLTMPKIAERMDRSLHSVNKLWVRGVKKMRTLMERYDL